MKGVLLSSVSSCVQEAHRSWRVALPKSQTSPAWTSLTTVRWMSPPPAKLIKISFLGFFSCRPLFLSGYMQGWTQTCPRCWCGWQRTDQSGTSRWAKTSTTSSPSKIKWVSTHQEETLAYRSAETWFVDSQIYLSLPESETSLQCWTAWSTWFRKRSRWVLSFPSPAICFFNLTSGLSTGGWRLHHPPASSNVSI